MERLKNILNDIDKEHKWLEWYIYECEDYANNYSVLIGDNFIYNKDRIKSIFEGILETSISNEEYEHLNEYIIDGDIESQLSTTIIDDMVEVDFFPITEEEHQLSEELYNKLKDLSNEEFDHIQRNAELYIGDDRRFAYYYGGHTFGVSLYINEDDLINEYKKLKGV